MRQWKVLGAGAMLFFAACGELASNGLKPGEQRGNEADEYTATPLAAPPGIPSEAPAPVSPLTDTTGTTATNKDEEPKGPPIPVRVLHGEFQEPVVIGSSETILLTSDTLADGTSALPVFHALVTVAEGAVLHGAARFEGGLKVAGTEDQPVVWHLDPKYESVATDFNVEWAKLIGGKVEVDAVVGKISTFTNATIDSSQVRARGVEGARLDITWCSFNSSRIVLEVPSTGATSARDALLRLVNTDINLSELIYPLSVSTFTVEANNFLDVRVDHRYLSGAGTPGPRDQEQINNLRKVNYFRVHPDVVGGQAASAFAWIATPFEAGTGRGDAVATWAKLFQSRTWLERVIYPYRHIVMGDQAYGIGFDVLADAVRQAATAELRRYAYANGHEDAPPLNLTFSLGEAEPCVKRNWSTVVCPSPFTIKVALKVVEPQKPARTLAVTKSFTDNEPSPAMRQMRLAAIELINQLADDGTLVPAQIVQTPYF